MQQQNKFYNYIYLDPRKPGQYCYEGLNFSLLYEPFYVGKGSNKRLYNHLRDSHLKIRSHKSNKIKAIIKLNFNMKNFIMQINKNLSNEQSCENEMNFISIFGRLDINTGCLCNRTSGGEGTVNYIFTDEHKKKLKTSALKRDYSNDKERSEKVKQSRLMQGNTRPKIKFLVGINDVEFCFIGSKQSLYKAYPHFSRETYDKCIKQEGTWISHNSFKFGTVMKLKITLLREEIF